jgi:hypothetical protein
MDRSSIRPALVVIRLDTRYGVPGVPPDNHTVAVVLVLVEELIVIPADAVIVEAEMVSPVANHADQSHFQSRTASASLV